MTTSNDNDPTSAPPLRPQNLEEKLWEALEVVEDQFMNAGMHTMEIEVVVARWLASLQEATHESDANQEMR